jgi:hypothetical protein
MKAGQKDGEDASPMSDYRNGETYKDDVTDLLVPTDTTLVTLDIYNMVWKVKFDAWKGGSDVESVQGRNREKERRGD